MEPSIEELHGVWVVVWGALFSAVTVLFCEGCILKMKWSRNANLLSIRHHAIKNVGEKKGKKKSRFRPCPNIVSFCRGEGARKIITVHSTFG